MELRTLGYFAAVADTGTVSAAAERVHVAQPSLSRQLRALERSLGVDLFLRAPGRLALSPAGRALLPQVRRLLADADALRRAAQVQAAGGLEQVTIAAPATTLTDVVSPFVATLRVDDPVPHLHELHRGTAQEALADGADLAIVLGRPGGSLDSRELLPLPLWAYVPWSHPWRASGAPLREVALADLVAQDLVVLPTDRPARRVLDAAMLAAGLAPRSVVEAGSGTVAQALCVAGRGIAVVSDDARFGLEGSAVCSGAGTRLSLHLHVAWDPGHPAAGTLAALADRLGAWVTEHYAPTRP